MAMSSWARGPCAVLPPHSVIISEEITTMDMNLGRYTHTWTTLRTMLERISLKKSANIMGNGKPNRSP